MSFTHLHVTTAFTPGVGTASPAELARAAAEDGATALACTDRDGLYGAVQHVLACQAHGLAPLLGVDLAVIDVDDDGARRRVTGRVVALAHGGGTATPGAGYRALCRLVTDAHAHTTGRSHGGTPVGVTRQELAARAVDPESGLPVLTVLLGPESDVGLAMHGPRYLRPRTLFKEWLAAMPTGTIAGEVVSHQAAPGHPFTTAHAARMLKLAREHHVPAILSNAVRHLHPDSPGPAAAHPFPRPARPAVEGSALSADDAAQRSTQGSARPSGTQAHLKSHREMEQTAREVGHAADLRVKDLMQLLRDTEELAETCRLDPAGDLGWGRWQLPESSVLGLARTPHAELTERCQDALKRRIDTRAGTQAPRFRERLEHELAVVESHEASLFFLNAAEVTQTINDSGVRAVGRGDMTASLIAHLLGITAVNPLEREAPFERFLAASASSGGLDPFGSFPGLELDLESGSLREVRRTVARRFGKGRVCLLGPAQRTAATDAEEGSEASPEALVEVPGIPDAAPGALSRRSSGLAIGDASLLHRIPTQPGESGLPLSQLAPQDLSSWGVLRVTLRESVTQTVLARALREIGRQAADKVAPVGTVDAGAPLLDERPGRELVPSGSPSGCLDSAPDGRTRPGPSLAEGPTAGGQSVPPVPPVTASTDVVEDLYVRQTAWLRSHHPGAYLAALWDTPAGPLPRHLLRAEAGTLGVRVLPVDVNRSAEECQVEPCEEGPADDDGPRGTGLRLGLHEVPGISPAERRRLLSGRPYRSVEDLLTRGTVSRGTVRKLAEAGALDSLPGDEDGRDAHSVLVRNLQEFAARPAGSPRTQVHGQLTLPLVGGHGTALDVAPPEPSPDRSPVQPEDGRENHPEGHPGPPGEDRSEPGPEAAAAAGPTREETGKEAGHAAGSPSAPAELTVVTDGSRLSRARTPAPSGFPPRTSHRPDPARRTGSG